LLNHLVAQLVEALRRVRLAVLSYRGTASATLGPFRRLVLVVHFCLSVNLVLLSASIGVAAGGEPPSWNKSVKLKKAGYVELVGADLVSFLVGNSVLVEKSGPTEGAKDEIEIDAKTYYFLDDHTIYECGAGREADCTVRAWGLQDGRLCLDVGTCGEPPAILKLPSSARTVDEIGLYVWFDHFAYNIVKGNRTDGPLFSTRISARPIEVSGTDTDRVADEAAQNDHGSKSVLVSGTQASALLIGNTFLSDDAAQFSSGQVNDACPMQGTYYSPDGRIVSFTCHAGPSNHIWSVSVSHWKIESGLFCRDDPDEIGKFGCKPATVKVASVAVQVGAKDKILIQDLESGVALTGYKGNALNFRFKQPAESKKPKAR
jgi:hypothetical protein